MRNEDERLTVAAAAEELGIKERATRDLIRRGELPAYRPTPRKTWILRSDLAKFLESRRTSPAAPAVPAETSEQSERGGRSHVRS